MNVKLISAEIILLIASVFIFRSLWILLDEIEIMSNELILIISLILGIIFSIFALNYIIKKG